MSTEALSLPHGVFFESSRGRYRVRLYRCGRVWFLKYFDNPDDAIAARNAALEARHEADVRDIAGVTMPTIASLLRSLKRQHGALLA